MCTSLVFNGKKTVVGWNLDLLDMKHRVRKEKDGVYIEILDEKEGWMPLFGANGRGEFVGMPTCWPYDKRSDPEEGKKNVIDLNADLLLMKTTFSETKKTAEAGNVCSVKGLTFMSALSDADGNVLHIVPGQGYEYYEKPRFKVMTNFSPFKTDSEKHDWMGWDRYLIAVAALEKADDDFGVKECFEVLKSVSQTVCPTVVSMVFDVTDRVVYWCERREFGKVSNARLLP